MKSFLFLVFMLVSVQMYAQKFTSVKGFVKNDRLTQVELYKTVDGQPELYATSGVAPDGSYGFLFAPQEAGFYAVGDKRMNFMVYVKGGEEVNLDLYADKAQLNGKNTKENKALYQWEDYAADVRLKSVFFDRTISNYEDFFPEFEKFIAGRETLRKGLKSGNKEFDRMLQKLIDYETDYFAVIFLQTPRTKHPQRTDWPDYYHHIVSPDKFTTDEVLQFPYGVRMLSNYASFAHIYKNQKYSNPEEHTQFCLGCLGDKRLKGEYLLNSVFPRYKTYDNYLAGMKQYEEFLVTPSLKTRAETMGTKLYDTRSGGIAADFTYPDVNGKEVSLSDFKGKVVLVDVWATWCGPCRKEIPHLKKLEEEMKATDVVFVGVSVDEAKDKQKWLDFIKKEELAGVQLLASGWSKITKDYKINGIPRFMVFDRKGNIVSVDAPRPSNPALKALLEAELKK